MAGYTDIARSTLGPVLRGSGLAAVKRRVRDSRWYFDRVLDRYARSHATATVAEPDDPILATLLADGVVVLPGYHDPDMIRSLHDRLLPMLERVRRDEADPSWRTLRYAEDGIYRLQETATVVPEVAQVLDDRRLQEVARRYLGGTIRGSGHYVDYKPDFVHDHTTQLHMDSWQSQVKIFTLLCDVDEARAPLVYWKGSHRDAAWRRRFDHAFWLADEVGISGLFPASVVRRVAQEEGRLRELIATGTAGTVIMADTRGVHRASNLRRDYRLELVQKFTQPVIA
jgi:hypothetical protein